MSVPRIPIARIKSNALRRACMCIVFPLLIVCSFKWRVITIPLAVAWEALREAGAAARDVIADELASPYLRLLMAAWAAMWREPMG